MKILNFEIEQEHDHFAVTLICFGMNKGAGVLIRNRNGCKSCFHDYSSKHDSTGLPNRHLHYFYLSQIAIYSFSISTRKQPKSQHIQLIKNFHEIP